MFFEGKLTNTSYVPVIILVICRFPSDVITVPSASEFSHVMRDIRPAMFPIIHVSALSGNSCKAELTPFSSNGTPMGYKNGLHHK